jgi:hypothetical protein
MRKIVDLKLSLLALVFAGACSQSTAAIQDAKTLPELVAALAQFTRTDLEAARDRAVKGEDLIGMDCWDGLLSTPLNLPDLKQKFAGIADAHEALRLGRTEIPGSAQATAKALKRACAAMIMDDRDFYLKLAAQIAAMRGGGFGAGLFGATLP